MLAHVGPADGVFGVDASVVRHSDAPPASNVFESFGSSTKGAMKFARELPQESVIV